jgi:hypothetical protein
MPIVLGHQINELPVTVVLGNRRRAVLVDAAWHLSIVVLKGRIPIDEVLHVGGVPEPKQCGGSQ